MKGEGHHHKYFGLERPPRVSGGGRNCPCRDVSVGSGATLRQRAGAPCNRRRNSTCNCLATTPKMLEGACLDDASQMRVERLCRRLG